MKRVLPFLGLIILVVLIFVNGTSAQGTWTRKADFSGEGRQNAFSFTIGNKCYIGKGLNDIGQPLSDFWEWDQSNNVWTRKADFPGNSIIGAVCFSIGTKGYVGTGDDINFRGSKEFWEYDPSTDTWTQKADFAGPARTNAVGFAIGNKGYIGTGLHARIHYQDFWEYDPSTDTWTQKADFAGPARSHAIGFSIGTKGYIGTGRQYVTDPNIAYVLYKDFWEWDQESNTWTPKADLAGSDRFGAVGFSIGNKGYIGIGYLGQVTSLRDFWEWDKESDTWTRKTDYKGIGSFGATGFSIGNKGYIGLRSDVRYEHDVEISYLPHDFWEYDPSGTQDPHTDIIPNGAVVKKLSNDQFYFINGPVWYRDSVLLFSSGDPAHIYSYDPLLNQFKVFRLNTNSNGLTLDKDSNLLACAPKVVMLDKTGKVMKTLAEKYNEKPFNSPNDIIADSMGGAYFSDISFFSSPVQDKEAVYYVDPMGTVKRVIDDLIKPNGLVLSPDGKKLYVDDSFDKYLYSWDVAPDGSLSGKSTLAELKTTGGAASGADGMAIDENGNLYVCSDIGIQVFSPQGDSLTVIAFPERPSNCDFGGKDFKTLFVTTNTNLYSIDLNYRGYAVSRTNPSTGTETPLFNQLSVELYPNPVSNFLYVRHSLGKVNSIDIVNIAGQKESIFLKKQEGTSIEINTQKFQPGMYILRIVSDAGVVTRKFVKE